MAMIIVTSEEQLLEQYKELANTLLHLRVWEKYWQDHFGGYARNKMLYWQKRADELLTSLGLGEHTTIKNVRITRD